MSAKKPIVIAAIVLASVAVGGAGAWFAMQKSGGKAGHSEASAEPVDYKYVNLDKVIVMLRDDAGGPLSHYLSIDIVFKTTAKQEKMAKEHLPLLRSVALKALAEYPMEKASRMSIDQFSAAINKAFSAAYAHDKVEKPFADAMIGKLIIE